MVTEKQRRVKVGVVSNEFFDTGLGRMGGFGWATRQVARTFGENPELGVDAVFLAREHSGDSLEPAIEVHGTRLIPRDRSRLRYVRTIWSEKLDVLLSIDFRPNYMGLFKMLPRTPIIVWVRDPRPPEDTARIRTIRVPGQEEIEGQGLVAPDCTSFAGIVRMSSWVRRPILFGTPAPFLAQKIPGTLGVTPGEVALLPNIIDMDPGEIRKHATPRVAFLGRLDPYKRPWLFADLGRRFPDVEFLLLGNAFFTGAGAWAPENLPANVKVLGHVDGDEKINILNSAWVLVNTSVHEGLAVSFQEALRCATPVLSTVNPQDVVSRFGMFVGPSEGTGLDTLPRFEEALQTLLTDHALRRRLGREGREWVMATHSRERFLESFFALCRKAGVTMPANPVTT